MHFHVQQESTAARPLRACPSRAESARSGSRASSEITIMRRRTISSKSSDKSGGAGTGIAVGPGPREVLPFSEYCRPTSQTSSQKVCGRIRSCRSERGQRKFLLRLEQYRPR
jgi:hypothetical protein